MGLYLCSNWHDFSHFEYKILSKNIQEKKSQIKLFYIGIETKILNLVILLMET